MKNLVTKIVMVTIFFSQNSIAQNVGVGTTMPNANALLHVDRIDTGDD